MPTIVGRMWVVPTALQGLFLRFRRTVACLARFP